MILVKYPPKKGNLYLCLVIHKWWCGRVIQYDGLVSVRLRSVQMYPNVSTMQASILLIQQDLCLVRKQACSDATSLVLSSLYTGMCHLSTDCLEITDQNELTGLQNPERKSSPSMVNLCFQNWHRCFEETRNGKEMNLSEAEGKRTSFQCEDKPTGLYKKSHHVCTPQLLPAIADSALEHCHPPPQVTAVCDCVSSTSCQQL